MFKKSLLIITLFASAQLMAADKNQYGGYNPQTVLSAHEVHQLMNDSNYIEVHKELKSILNQFYQERLSYLAEVHHALKTDNKIPYPPQLPELTTRQMSFMSDKMIARWNEQREAIKEHAFLPFGSVAKLEKARKDTLLQQQVIAEQSSRDNKLSFVLEQ